MSPWTCESYYLSSAPHEVWIASPTSGNFTLGHSQSICLLHVSDNITTISGDFDIQTDHDFLDCEYSGSQSQSHSYTGIDTISNSSNHFTSFHWSSDECVYSTSVSIELSSPLSSLPYRGCSGYGTSRDPIILMASLPIRTRSRSAIESSALVARATGTTGADQGQVSGALSLGAGAVAGIVIGCVAGCCLVLCIVVHLRRKRRSPGLLLASLNTEVSSESGALPQMPPAPPL